jgi:hypothetical protein
MRRKADAFSRSRSYSPSRNGPPFSGSHAVPPSSKAPSRGGGLFRSRRSGGAEGSGSGVPIWLLLLVAAGITLASYVLVPNPTSGGKSHLSSGSVGLSPSKVRKDKAPKNSKDLYTVNGIPVNDATKKMHEHESRWVDGEKALKEQLKKLAVLQSQGKELGVPALTRYLGETFPAWAGEGVDRALWEARRDAKYAEMRAAEDEWNRKIADIIARDKERG